MKLRNRAIAIAEDDQDDRELTRDAFATVCGERPLEFFNDGVELLEYLRKCADVEDRSVELPAMILLDLNMPRIDGRQALRQIRADARLQHVPVVMLSTSRSERDIKESYRNGANSFITKPPRFQGLVDAVRSLDGYWFSVASLPE